MLNELNLTAEELEAALGVELDAVIDQHKQNTPSDIFTFSWHEAQQFFDDKNLSIKYGIDPPYDHIILLQELARRGAFKIKFIGLKSYSGHATDIYYKDPSDPDIQGCVIPVPSNNTIMPKINDKYCMISIFFNNQDMREYQSSAKKEYKAYLCFDDSDYSYLRISIKNDHDYIFRQLAKTGYPYKVFSYAAEQRLKKKRTEPIQRDELIKEGKMSDMHKYVNNLFKDQPVISEALSPFVTLETQSIYLERTAATITENQRRVIQKCSRKII